MKVSVMLRSDPVRLATEQAIGLTGAEIVRDPDEAQAVITDGHRLMLSCLKRGKQVVQFLAGPQDQPAEGLLGTYPEQFKVFMLGEVAPMMGHIAELARKSEINLHQSS
ncbi:MAG: hypothetical protein WDZ79_02260 [Candidatus Paceibacterota bacterium]